MTPERLQAALASLPHGPEFRFLDQLTSLEPGQAAEGIYTVRPDEAFLRGHFPGQPLFPGVLLVEAAAQLAGIIIHSDQAADSTAQLRLTALRGVKIFDSARPGETIRYQARLLRRLGSLATAEAVACVGERVILQAEITLSAQ